MKNNRHNFLRAVLVYFLSGNFLNNNKFSIIVFVLSSFLTVLFSYYSHVLKNAVSENDVVKEQIQRVDIMSDNLKEMIDFLDVQKKKITEEQLLLENIQQQRRELEPLLNTEKRIVENILSVQAKYVRKNIWIDWTIAFLLGVASSTLATLIVRKIGRKKENDAE